MDEVKAKMIRLGAFREDPDNVSEATDEEIQRLAAKLRRVPLGLTAMRIAYVTDAPGGGCMVISGNKRLRCLKAAYGDDGEVPAEWFADVTAMSEAERHDFRLNANISDGHWNIDKLLQQYGKDELTDAGLDELLQEIGDGKVKEGFEKGCTLSGALAERFGVPPFSVLFAFKGEWAKRKKAWRQVIASKGESRENTLAAEGSIVAGYNNGVSLFDPVLAELCCKWFAPDGGSIFDPFAGDVFKGLVFGLCKHPFCGIELRQEQVAENEKNLSRFTDLPVRYVCDDGQNVAQHFAPESQDMLFSCPPYYDLEVYSDKPNDASNQPTYADFLGILRRAFTDALGCLKPNRFAVVVVGDVRDKRGCYYDFPGDVTRIFAEAGAPLYNELIMVDTVGTACFRANNSMRNRKVVKIHQNVLVFFKGDPKTIKQNYTELKYADAELDAYLPKEENEDDAHE